MMKKDIEKMVGEAGNIRLDEEVLGKLRTLDDSELDALEVEIKRKLLKKRSDFLQRAKSIKHRRLARVSKVSLN